MAKLNFWKLFISVYLLSITVVISHETRQKRAVNNLGEYIQSIKSLKHKRKVVLNFIEQVADTNPENFIHTKIWIKKRSHDLSENVGCAPAAKIWTDVDINSFESYPTESSNLLIFI